MSAVAHTTDTHTDIDTEVHTWAQEVWQPTMSWLMARRSDHTKTAYATRLGIPREQQAWRGATTRGNRAKPSPVYAWFPWCAMTGTHPLTGVTVDVVRAWIATMRHHGATDATIQSYTGAVAAWYREMRKRGLTEVVLSDLLDTDERRAQGISSPSPTSPTHALTYEQAQALRVAARLDPLRTRARNLAMIEVLLSTGIRAAELCQLTRGSVARDASEAILTVHGKGGRTRSVRLTGPVVATIDAYLTERDQATTTELTIHGQVGNRNRNAEPLFAAARSLAAITPAQVRQTLSRMCAIPGRVGTTPAARRASAELAPICPSIHPHQLRRFYAVHAVTMGATVEQVRADLGHASLTTTQRYLTDAARIDSSGAYTVSASLAAGAPEWGIPSPKI